MATGVRVFCGGGEGADEHPGLPGGGEGGADAAPGLHEPDELLCDLPGAGVEQGLRRLVDVTEFPEPSGDAVQLCGGVQIREARRGRGRSCCQVGGSAGAVAAVCRGREACAGEGAYDVALHRCGLPCLGIGSLGRGTTLKRGCMPDSLAL